MTPKRRTDDPPAEVAFWDTALPQPPVRAAVVALTAFLAAPAIAGAQAAEKQTLAVTNAAGQMAFCTLLVDGKALKELAIRPGRTYAEAFDPRRQHQLVCNRAVENVYAVTPGRAYRVETDGRKITLAEAAAE